MKRGRSHLEDDSIRRYGLAAATGEEERAGCYTRAVRVSRGLQALLIVLVLAGVALAGLATHRFWRRQLSHVTGDALWVWATDALERVHPVAALFVADLRLDSQPAEALLKVCGDREYVVYVNGTAAACGWSRPGFRLDLFDVGHLLRQGENVVAVEVRSPTPAGGLLLSLDVAGVGPNVLVTGRDFRSRGRFALDPPGDGDLAPPVIWGGPPRLPWGYPTLSPRPRTLPECMVEDPRVLDRQAAEAVPGGGTCFRLPSEQLGYLWLVLDGDAPFYITTTDDSDQATPEELRARAQPVVALRGQQRWLDPQPRRIAAVYVFGMHSPRGVEVWPIPEEFSSAAPGVVQGTRGPVARTRWTTRIPPG